MDMVNDAYIILDEIFTNINVYTLIGLNYEITNECTCFNIMLEYIKQEVQYLTLEDLKQLLEVFENYNYFYDEFDRKKFTAVLKTVYDEEIIEIIDYSIFSFLEFWNLQKYEVGRGLLIDLYLSENSIEFLEVLIKAVNTYNSYFMVNTPIYRGSDIEKEFKYYQDLLKRGFKND